MNTRFVVDSKRRILQVLLGIKDYEQLLVKANETEKLAKLRKLKKDMPRLMGAGKNK